MKTGDHLAEVSIDTQMSVGVKISVSELLLEVNIDKLPVLNQGVCGTALSEGYSRS